MKLAAFIAFIATVVIISSPASAAWQEYIYEDLGIAKEFPVEPERTVGVYEALDYARDEVRVAGVNLPAIHFTAEVDNIVYRMSVVDVSDNIEQGANILGECLYLIEQSGFYISNIHLGVGGGDAEVFGRLATVDLYGDRGRMQMACFVNNATLYRIEAHVLPEHGNLDAPEAARFVTTQRFDIYTDFAAEEAQALVDYEYFLEHGVYPHEVQD